MTDILEYVMVENIMSKELCRDIIEMTSKCAWKKHTWSHNDYHDVSFSKDSEEFDIQNSDKDLFELLKPSIITKVERYQDKFGSDGEMLGNFIGKFTIRVIKHLAEYVKIKPFPSIQNFMASSFSG